MGNHCPHRAQLPKCSKCHGPRDRKGRYCRACHNRYMRVWRGIHPDRYGPHERARGCIKMRVARGLVPRPDALHCVWCGSKAVGYGHPCGFKGWRARFVLPACAVHLKEVVS